MLEKIINLFPFIKEIKFYIYAAGVLSVFSVILGSYLYINNLQETNKSLSNDIIKYEQAVQTQKNTIDNLQSDIKSIKDINENLQNIRIENIQKINSLQKELSKILQEEITDSNSKEQQDKLNVLLKEELRCIELASGKKAKKDEKNSICDDYIK